MYGLGLFAHTHQIAPKSLPSRSDTLTKLLCLVTSFKAMLQRAQSMRCRESHVSPGTPSGDHPENPPAGWPALEQQSLAATRHRR